MTQITDFNMQLAEPLIDIQILYIHVRLVHMGLLISEVESIGFSTPQ